MSHNCKGHQPSTTHADFDETLQIHSAAKNIRHLFIVIGNCLRLEGENSTLT